MMTSRQRVAAAFSFEEVDRVPVWCHVVGLSRRTLGVSYSEYAQSAEVAARCQLAWNDLIGDDFVDAYFDVAVEAAGFGQRMIYPQDEAAFTDASDYLIKNPDDYHKLEKFDVHTAPRVSEVLRMAEILANEVGEKRVVLSTPLEPFVTLGLMRGVSELLMDCVRNPNDVRAGLETVTDMSIEYVRALVNAGVSVIQFAHDYGNRAMMGPKMWLDLAGDCLRRLQSAVQETGAKLVHHNCDKVPYVDEAFDDIGHLDATMIWSLPASCTSWSEFKATYGNRATVFGCLEPVHFGTELSYEQAKVEALDQLRTFAPGGGFILSTACEFPANGSMHNAKAMVDACRDYEPA